MYRVEDKPASDTLLSLVSSSVSGTVKKSDDAFAEIRSFQSSFKQLSRTPEMIRIMLQLEFNFDGVVDAGGLPDKTARAAALQADWYDTSFVIVDYSNVEPWVQKCVNESEKGRTVVALVPSRTNTAWFHEMVLEMADEIRFVKGKTTLTGHARPSAYADAIAVYRRHVKKRDRPARGSPSVAILKCSTSFTGDSNTFEASLE